MSTALLSLLLGATFAPTADVPMEKLRRDHPRVLATAADFAEVKTKAKTNPDVARWLVALRKEADACLSKPLLKHELPDGKRLLSISREATNRMHLLGLMYQLDGDPKYRDRAWRELENVAGFPDWNTAHFLDTAEMTHACAIGYDWFFNIWDADQKKTIRDAIVRLGIKPGLSVYRSKGGGWSKAVHNWNQVCNGGLTLGALAIADEEPELCKELIGRAIDSVGLALAEYPPDGGYKEGPGYWGYGTTFQAYMIAGLESAFGTDMGLADSPSFDKTGWFPLQMTGPNSRFFNFADADERGRAPTCLAWLGRRFHEPYFIAAATRDARPEPLNVLWAPAKPVEVDWENTPKAVAYGGAEVVAMRGSWTDPKTTYVAFKAGSPHFNHAQMDVGSFVLDSLGERWAIDLGKDDYNAPGYFDTKRKRWDFYRNRAEGHNTLVIDPSHGPDQEREPVSKITRFKAESDRAFAITDMTSSYGPRAKKVTRGIALVNGRDVLVQDEVETNDRPLLWSMHTKASIAMAPDGRSARLSQGGKELTARLIGEDGASFTTRPAAPLPGSPIAQGQHENKGVQVLTVRLEKARIVRIGVWLSPVGAPAPSALKALSEW